MENINSELWLDIVVHSHYTYVKAENSNCMMHENLVVFK